MGEVTFSSGEGAVRHSRQVSAQGLIKSTTWTFRCNRGTADNLVQQFVGERTDDGFYTKHQISRQAGDYETLSITFEDIQAAELPVSRYQMRSSLQQTPIENSEDYYTFWNHDIIALNAEAGTPTGNKEALTGWYGITDATPYAAEKDTFRWLKYSQAVPVGWKIVVGCDKPGVNSFLVPISEVVETIIFRNELGASINSMFVGALSAPDQTFGRSDDNDKWLITGSDIQKVNDWFVVTNTYQYLAGGWDTDIYVELGG